MSKYKSCLKCGWIMKSNVKSCPREESYYYNHWLCGSTDFLNLEDPKITQVPKITRKAEGKDGE